MAKKKPAGVRSIGASNVAKPIGPPAPFSKPPSQLEPFLETLDPEQVYIFHIDSQPWRHKRQIFAVPVLMNLAIVFGLVWRLYTAIPDYLQIAANTFANQGKALGELDRNDAEEMMWLLAGRSSMFMLDYFLFMIVASWPRDFFLSSPGNPVKWRWMVGFQDREIVIRVSRKWTKDLSKSWMGQESSPVWHERIMPAIDRTYLQKTAYLLLDKNYDLDFQGMIDAHALVKQGRASLEDFQKAVVAHDPQYGWLIWSVHKAEKVDESADDEKRKKIVAFKDRLTAMGKENLFFKWIEMIQYETAQPGGFTVQRQTIAMKRAKEMFEEQGVDWEEFSASVGGVEGLPGMEVDT